MASNMTEERSSPDLDYDEKKPDLDDSYSSGINSHTGVFGFHLNRFHWCMIISIVALASLFALGAIGMIIGFMVQQNKLSKLELQLIAYNDSLSKRIDDLELQLSHCKQCSSTVHSNSSSYDDQELSMKLDNIVAAQTEIHRQLNSVQFTLSNHERQILALQQQAQENITRIESLLFGLGEHVANISEQIDHLSVMRDDHSDQLSQLNSSITFISTQVTHFHGSINNLTSGLDAQGAVLTSLDDRVSSLDSDVDEINRRDAAKDAQLEQRISQTEEHVNRLQMDNDRLSNQLSTIDGQLDNLETDSTAAAAFYPLQSTVKVLISSMIMIFMF